MSGSGLEFDYVLVEAEDDVESSYVPPIVPSPLLSTRRLDGPGRDESGS